MSSRGPCRAALLTLDLRRSGAGSNLDVQDECNEYRPEAKLACILAHIRKCGARRHGADVYKPKLSLDYLSASGAVALSASWDANPQNIAAVVNAQIAAFLRSDAGAFSGGVLLCDFPSEDLVQAIVRRNTLTEAPASMRGWMRRVPDGTPIVDLCLPGTHDSGARAELSEFASRPGNKAAAQKHDMLVTQDTSITEQLAMGIRWLDIRVVRAQFKAGGGDFQDPDWYTGHGAYVFTETLADIAAQVRAFLEAEPSEVVFLRVKLEQLSALKAAHIRWRKRFGHTVGVDGAPYRHVKLSKMQSPTHELAAVLCASLPAASHDWRLAVTSLLGAVRGKVVIVNDGKHAEGREEWNGVMAAIAYERSGPACQ